jgi:hypothetical protein
MNELSSWWQAEAKGSAECQDYTDERQDYTVTVGKPLLEI